MNLLTINTQWLAPPGEGAIRIKTSVRVGIALCISVVFLWIIGAFHFFGLFALFGIIVFTTVILLLMRGLELLLRSTRVKGSIRFTRSHIIFESNRVHKIEIQHLAPIQIKFSLYEPMEHRLVIKSPDAQPHYAVFKFKNPRDITRFRAWLYLVQLQGVAISPNTQSQIEALLQYEAHYAQNSHPDFELGYVYSTPDVSTDADFGIDLDFDALD